jgi:hypothetical protein
MGRLLMLGLLGNCLRLFALSVFLTTFALAGAIGLFAVLILAAPALTNELGAALGLFLGALCLPTAFFVAAGVHEAGHLLAGACVGFRPQFAHVGPLTWTRTIRGGRLGWDRRQPWLGGRAVCTIRTPSRRRMAIFLLGGPFANLASGLFAAALAISALSALPRCFLGMFAIISLLLGAANLLPLRECRLDSDGLALWRLFVGGSRGRL